MPNTPPNTPRSFTLNQGAFTYTTDRAPNDWK